MLVSVVIPCYNVEDYLPMCLDSVLEQSYEPLEIICVENNSTDGTAAILSKYENKYPGRITVLKETKQGAPAARNKGLFVARGEWIQFLDADDKLLPDKIKHQVEAIRKKQEQSDVVISPLTRILETKKIAHIEIIPDIWMALVISRAGSTCSNLYRKAPLIKINGWDETRVSSQEAWLLFSLLKSNINVLFFDKDETIVHERGSGSISNTNRGDNWQRYLLFRKEIWKYLQEKNLLTSELEQKLKGYIFDSIRMIYGRDPKQALELYKAHVKGHFTPVPSDATSAKYILIYKMLGFGLAQKLFALLKR